MSDLWYLLPVLLILTSIRGWIFRKNSRAKLQRSLFARENGFQFSAKRKGHQMPDFMGLPTFSKRSQAGRFKNVLRKSTPSGEIWMFSCPHAAPRSDDSNYVNVFYAELPGLELPAFEMSRQHYVDNMNDESPLGRIARNVLAARQPIAMPESELWTLYHLFGDNESRIQALFRSEGLRNILSGRFWLGSENAPALVGFEGGGQRIALYQEGRWLKPTEYRRLLLAGESLVRALNSDMLPNVMRDDASTFEKRTEAKEPGPFAALTDGWNDVSEKVTRVIFALSLIPSLGLTIYLLAAEGKDVETGVLLAMIAYCWSIMCFRAWRPPKGEIEGWRNNLGREVRWLAVSHLFVLLPLIVFSGIKMAAHLDDIDVDETIADLGIILVAFYFVWILRFLPLPAEKFES